MKLKKNIIPAIGCASILLTGITLSHEIILSEIQLSISSVPTDKKAVKDPAVTTITAEILTPIRQQEQRRNTFSRSMPSRSNTYDLVEVSSDPTEGARYFNVLVTDNKNSLIFGSVISKPTILNAVPKSAEPTQAIIVEPKIEPKTFLKLKYLTETKKVLIQQDNEWVEKSQHKFLKFLPITETTK